MMKRVTRLLAAAAAAVFAGALAGCAQPGTFDSQLVSISAAGTDSANGRSFAPVVSPDGTKVAFVSEASNLGAIDTNGVADVYVRDLSSGVTHLASKNFNSSNSGNGASSNPVWNPESTAIAYVSEASNLGPTDTNLRRDVYTFTLFGGITRLVSASVLGDSGNGESGEPAFGRFGRVAFASDASNLGPADANGLRDVYWRDLATNNTRLASVNAAGTNGGNGASEAPVFSPDGVNIGFVSTATDLAGEDRNTVPDVYVNRLALDQTLLISDGIFRLAQGGFGPVFSPVSDKVAFVSRSGSLGPTDTNGAVDVYLRDMNAPPTSATLVSANAAGTDSGNRASTGPVFSPDGSDIAFVSGASNLGPTDTGTTQDVYLRDLTAKITTLVSVNAAGSDAGNRDSDRPTFDSTGTRVAFQSSASNLVGTDTNGGSPFARSDVFVRELAAASTRLVSSNADDSDSANGDSGRAAFAGSSTRVVFESDAPNLGPADTNNLVDVFLAIQAP